MKEILSHVYRDENRGTSQEVVKEALLKTVEVENYLIAPIHKLLGTGNNITDYIFFNVVDTLFGGLLQYLLDLHYDV